MPCGQERHHQMSSRQEGAMEAVLLFGSHNVNGACGSNLGARLAGFVRLWCIKRLAVVCVQETHLTDNSAKRCEILMNEMAGRMGHPGWDAFWSHNTGSSAGVGILVNRALLSSGRVMLRNNKGGKKDVDVIVPGRVMQLALDWGGHSLSIGCLYLPSSDANQQKQIILNDMGPLMQYNGRSMIWAGDYNFVQNIDLDRCLRSGDRRGDGLGTSSLQAQNLPSRVSHRQLAAATAAAAMAATAEAAVTTEVHIEEAGSGHASSSASRPIHKDVKTAELFGAACPDLVDSFRRLHPQRKTYTFIDRRWASRLDRFMASSSLSSFVVACDNLDNSSGDHRPVGLSLVAKKSESPEGKGLKRTRIHFFYDRDLREEFEQWLQERFGSRPLYDDHMLLAWWPRFKNQLVKKVAGLNKVAKYNRLFYRGAAVEEARSRLDRAIALVDIRGGEGEFLEEAIKARKQFADVTKIEDRELMGDCRRDWVRGKEKPSPLITKLTQAPQEDKHVVALRDPSGRLEGDPHRMAAIVARFWAGTSRAAPTDDEAKATVLAPLRGDPRRQIGVAAATALGDKAITPKEVADALKKTKGSNSPGPDGLPYDLYKKYKDLFSPVLAGIFSAVGRLGVTPTGFLDGVISTLFKKGDRTLPCNYRPITLLNTDYRLLAKVLAARLGRVLKGVVSSEQTAFLAGRNIGENIMLLKLLPRLFKSRGQVGVIAFCDFAKAYDTIDRDFLYRAMECMGLGEGFIGWVKTLLLATRACASVNGVISKKELFSAGVRQGCPLAPLLYLVVAQALHSWLHAQGFGVDLEQGAWLTAAQYADDTKVILKELGEEEVRKFLDTMTKFQRASGQRLNENKTELLPIGALDNRPLPTAVCNLRVVNAARGVGIIFSNNEEHARPTGQRRRARLRTAIAPTSTETSALLAEVRAGAAAHRLASGPATRQATQTATEAVRVVVATAMAAAAIPIATVPIPPPEMPPKVEAGQLMSIKGKYGTIARLGLSLFGRAAAAASYGVSTMLFHAEHEGMPDEDFTSGLQKATTRLVDRGQAPDDPHMALTGVPSTLLHGSPREGGFGGIAWREHILARHAVWAARLIMGGSTPQQPCYHVANLILKFCHKYLTPLAMGCMVMPRDMGVFPAGPLAKLHNGLRALPPLEDVCEPRLIPGDWCFGVPLWGNPLLSSQLMEDDLTVLRNREGFEGIGDLLIQESHTLGALLLSLHIGCMAAYIESVFLLGKIQLAKSRLARDWLEAAATAREKMIRGSITRPSIAEALAVLLPRLGWKLHAPGQLARVIMLSALSVKDATALQLGGSRNLRLECHTAFVNEAMERVEGSPLILPEYLGLLAVFSNCWDICWENKQKEIFWRVAVDGVQDGHRWENLAHRVCACGVTNPRREHYFWLCPVAKAVLGEIERCCPGHPCLSRKNVWPMQPPEGVLEIVWRVVCLAGLNSMEVGRRSLQSQKLHRLGCGREVDPDYRPRLGRGSAVLRDGAFRPILSNSERVEAAKASSIIDFWGRIADFSALHRGNVDEIKGVGFLHPFIHVVSGKVKVNMCSESS